MSFVTSMLRQTAVYWGPGTPDGYGGWTYAEPVEITCRWQEEESLVVGADGEIQPPGAKVFSETELMEAGWLYLGTLADLSSAQEGDPASVTGAFRIRSVLTRMNIPTEVVMYTARL